VKREQVYDIAMEKIRSSKEYINATPEQKAALEQIVKSASKSGAAAVGHALALFASPALKEYYSTSDGNMIADALAAGLNAFRAASILDALMAMWPDATTAPPEAVQAGCEATEIYHKTSKVFGNISCAIVADKQKAEEKA